jgi:hypothetical protein
MFEIDMYSTLQIYKTIRIAGLLKEFNAMVGRFTAFIAPRYLNGEIVGHNTRLP